MTVHLARQSDEWPRDAVLTAACGATPKTLKLRKQLRVVTCRRCLAIADAEKGHPWLVFAGMSCALVWARTKTEASEQWRVEWARQHQRRAAPIRGEFKVRRLRLDDESWIRQSVIETETRESPWLKALRTLSARERRRAA